MPIPAPVRGIDAIDAVAAEQEWLVSARQCREAGVDHGVIRLLLRRGAWRRVTRGVYDVDPFPGERGSYDRRRRRAAWSGLLAYGPDAVRFYTKRKTITQRWPSAGVREGTVFSFPSNR